MYKVYYVSENPDNDDEPSSLVIEHGDRLAFDYVKHMKISLESFGLKKYLADSDRVIWGWGRYYEAFPDDRPELVGEVNSVDELEALIRILILTFGE